MVEGSACDAQLRVSLLGLDGDIEHELLIAVLHGLKGLGQVLIPQGRPLSLPVL